MLTSGDSDYRVCLVTQNVTGLHNEVRVIFPCREDRALSGLWEGDQRNLVGEKRAKG